MLFTSVSSDRLNSNLFHSYKDTQRSFDLIVDNYQPDDQAKWCRSALLVHERRHTMPLEGDTDSCYPIGAIWPQA